MSEYTDDIINGDFDFRTGEYLGRGGGFPRSVNFPKKSNQINPEAIRNANQRKIDGVVNFLNTKGITGDNQMNVIRGFFDYDTSKLSKIKLCKKIQSRFKNFRKYVEKLIIECPKILK